MNISNHKLTNATWDAYNNMAMEEHNIVLDDQTPFGHTQWSNINYPLLQNHPQSSNSSLLPPPNALDQAWNFKLGDHGDQQEDEAEEDLGAMKEMMFKIAAMQPVDIDPATIRRPKRRNVRISDDPQSVAARHRRERISEKIRVLQRLVPGGTKMDTASMLDEAIRYVKFLKRQIRLLQSNHYPPPPAPSSAEDWVNAAAVTTTNASTSYMFGGNNIINEGGAGHDDPAMCFNHKFNIGHH